MGSAKQSQSLFTASDIAQSASGDSTNLKLVFDKIRNYLAGNAKGITKDERLAEEVIKILFCKIYDEQINENNNRFLAVKSGEKKSDLKNRVNSFLVQGVRAKYVDVPLLQKEIILDPESLGFVINELSNYELSKIGRDAIGDAFEAFFGPSLRGSDGQFFTPKNVVQLIVKIINPRPGELILDPACGSGGFLVETIDHLKQEHNSLKINSNKPSIFGIDKDRFLTEIAQTYLSLIGNGSTRIFCEDSLDYTENWEIESRSSLSFDKFDVVITNPPFGAKIPVSSDKLTQFHLGHKWGKHGNAWVEEEGLLDTQPPQILFIERCLDFLKEGGRLGIVLPEGIFGNPSDRYVWEYLFNNAKVLAIISLAQETFQPSTHTKTSVLILEKTSKPKINYDVFMAIADKIGHDKNGKPLYKLTPKGSYILDRKGHKVVDDDIPMISEMYFRKDISEKKHSRLGFVLKVKKLLGTKILIPEYYNPEIENQLERLEKTRKFKLVKFGELVEAGYITVTRGNEVGSQFYNTGDVPFARTSDIVNWEIKIDPVKCISEDIYNLYKNRQDVRAGDILFVNDGTFLIGRVAMVNEFNKKMVIQSHLKKIRVNPNPIIDNYLLFYLLNAEVVKKQINAKIFVQATISSLGSRLNEIMLPIPEDLKEKKRISEGIKKLLEEKEDLIKRYSDFIKL